MKISMTIPERIHTMSILPKEGNFLTLRLIRELVVKIGFSADEMQKYEIVEKNGLVEWNQLGNVPQEIEFVTAELDIIKKELNKLDAENRLDMNTFVIYEKFILR